MLGCLGALEKLVGVTKVNFEGGNLFDLASCRVHASGSCIFSPVVMKDLLTVIVEINVTSHQT